MDRILHLPTVNPVDAEPYTGGGSSTNAEPHGRMSVAIDRAALLNREFHAEGLSVLAARALRDGDFRTALALADRRCRIVPSAGAWPFLLRATAYSHLDERDQALCDIRKALDIEPEDDLANRALLALASGDERVQAAKILIRNDHRPQVLLQAMAALGAPGVHSIGALRSNFRGVRGWFSWRSKEALRLHLSWNCGKRIIELHPRHSHPLGAALGSAADLLIEWPAGANFLEVDVPGKSTLILEPRLLRPLIGTPSYPKRRPEDRSMNDQGDGKIAIIVPVYQDFQATEACFGTLINDTESIRRREIIVVDDASPDPQIRSLLLSLESAGAIVLLRNEQNLGFSRSINRAMETLTDEDVLLLNADTMVPPGFLDRLVRAAYSDEDVATVTPISNNGEYTSFPIPFRENEIPCFEAIKRTDQIAARVNQGCVTDMPNGTGFCMYIRRTCLDRIGALSPQFGRGYLEDVEFCLRAADAGFRNVCAADVFVGHAGSLSFRSRKRELVVRNLRHLGRRWPHYRSVSAAFMKADPLRAAREAIERASMKDMDKVRLLVVGETTERSVITSRASALGADKRDVLIATGTLTAGRLVVRLRRAFEGIPQNIRLEYPILDANDALFKELVSLRIEHIEFADLLATPASLVASLRALGVTYDIFVPGAGPACVRPGSAGRFDDFGQGTRAYPAGSSIFDCGPAGPASGGGNFWYSTIDAAASLVAANPQVAAAVTARFHRKVGISNPIKPVAVKGRSAASRGWHRCPCIGIVSDESAASLSFVIGLVRQFAREPIEVVVLGSTFDDLRVMAAGPAIVLGKLEWSEVPTLSRALGISHLLLLTDEAAAGDSGSGRKFRPSLPFARRSAAKMTTLKASGDLLLARDATVCEVADAVRHWVR